MSQQARAGRGRIRSVVGTILTVLVAFGLIGYGGYETWLQHSGTVASVHLKSCSSGRSRRGISWTQTCNGIWQHDGTKQTVRVYSVPRGRAGTDIDARIHGNDAYVTSFWGGPAPILLGVVLLGATAFAPLRRRRRQSSDDGYGTADAGYGTAGPGYANVIDRGPSDIRAPMTPPPPQNPPPGPQNWPPNPYDSPRDSTPT
jgi:hypothetical protein